MPTLKQKQALKKVIENRGNVSKSMIDVGYTENTAKNPSNLTNSKGWQELMEEYLPDKLLAEKHRKLLEKTDKKTKEIDVQAVSKGLELGYKLKGYNIPEKPLIEIKILQQLSPEELKTMRTKLKNNELSEEELKMINN